MNKQMTINEAIDNGNKWLKENKKYFDGFKSNSRLSQNCFAAKKVKNNIEILETLLKIAQTHAK